jgi:hypothetical protein
VLDGPGQRPGAKAAHKYRSSEPKDHISLRSHIESDELVVLNEQDVLEVEIDGRKTIKK